MESRWRRALPLGGLAALVGLGAGLLIAAMAGAMAAELWLWLPLFFGGVCGVAGYVIGVFAVEGSGDLLSRIHGGGPVGTRREYSEAQALAVRGEFGAALGLYLTAAEADPDDPEPLLRGARILRDELADPEGAAEWLRRAAATPGLSARAEFAVAQELAELYDGPLGTPERALPTLARLAERHADTRAGAWARRRMVELRVRVVHDVNEPRLPPIP